MAGAVIGAGIGLWFAPRSGLEMREQLSDSAKAMGKAVNDTVDDLAARGREAYERVRDIAARASEEIARAGEQLDRVSSETARSINQGINKGLSMTNDAMAAASSGQARRPNGHAADVG